MRKGLYSLLSDFNPRSPCGERRRVFRRIQSNAAISIHAPRVGSDRTIPYMVFYPAISIHAPRVGSDDCTRNCYHGLCISIHAPRVGSDWLRTTQKARRKYFNPRSPCGERPSAPSFVLRRILIFQSTLPVWGATRHLYCKRIISSISIHAPRVGSDEGSAAEYREKI